VNFYGFHPTGWRAGQGSHGKSWCSPLLLFRCAGFCTYHETLMIQARTEIQKKPSDPSDPTWLAYTLYGNPAAVLSKETPKLG